MEIRAQGSGRTAFRVGDTIYGRGHPRSSGVFKERPEPGGVVIFKWHMPPCLADGREGTKVGGEPEKSALAVPKAERH